MHTGDEDIDDEWAQIRAKRLAAEKSLREAFERSPAILVQSESPYSDDELWILSGETHPVEGKLRVTEFGRDGPHGHFSAQTVDEIVKEKVSDWHTYEPVDEAFVMEWTSTPEWAQGVKRIAYVQAYNQLMWVAGQHNASKVAMAAATQANAMEDIDAATALLEQAAADIQQGRVSNDRQLNRIKRRLSAR